MTLTDPISDKASGVRNRNRALRIVVQCIIGAGLIALLIWLAYKNDVVGTLKTVDPRYLIVAWLIWVISTAINSLRWKLLLANAGIERQFLSLWPLYLIGLFFSQFLPTGTGGDAVRVYEVSRRSGRIAAAIVAVLQERVFGLGVSMLIGLFATLYYWERLPPNFRPWVVLAQISGPIGLLVFLYPHTFVNLVLSRLGKIGQKIAKILKPVLDLPPLSLPRLLAVTSVTAIGVVVSISVYAVLAEALKVPVGLIGFLLAVPLVWIIKMAPISPGGAGVGELALVYVLTLIFSAEEGPATSLALVYLGLQILTALVGGLILAFRMATGTWIPPKAQTTVTPQATEIPAPATAPSASTTGAGS